LLELQHVADMNEIQLGLLWASRRVCNRAKLKKNMGELLNDGNKLHDMLQEEGAGNLNLKKDKVTTLLFCAVTSLRIVGRYSFSE
jgi:hypothetical protein